MKSMWTHSVSPPAEYIDLQLCRDVFHCTPDQLERQDIAHMRVYKALLTTESQVLTARANQVGRGGGAPAQFGSRGAGRTGGRPTPRRR